MRTAIKGLAILFIGLGMAAASYGDSFNWTFTATDGSGVSASGTFTATSIGPGEELINTVTGTYDGSAITSLLAPGACCGSPANDNDLFTSAPFLDIQGFAFSVGGLNVNLFFAGNDNTYQDCTQFNACTDSEVAATGSFTLSPVSVAPEPAALVMLLSGLTGLILLAKMKRYQAAAVLN